MADNYQDNRLVNTPSFRTVESGGVHHPVALLAFDNAGTPTLVSALNPLPGAGGGGGDASAANQVLEIAQLELIAGQTAPTGPSTAVADAVAVMPITATVTPTSRSGTITTGGASQQLMAANTARKGWFIQNNSTGDLWFDDTGVTADDAQPSICLHPGDCAYSDPSGVSTTAITIFGATTGQTFSAREW